MNTVPTWISRRAFLGKASLGSLALSSLLDPSLFAAAPDRWRGVIAQPHFPPKAKRVIWLTMAGGPSHLETFDHKPKLAELHGQPMPESFTKGQQLAQLQGAAADVLRAAVELQEVRQVRRGDVRTVPAHRHRWPTTSASSAR